MEYDVTNPRAEAKSALKQTEDIFQQVIIKTIAIFGIVDNEKLTLVSNTLKAAVNMSDENFNIAISMLQQNHILTL